MLGEGSLLVREHNRSHFIFSTATVVTIGRHSMVTEHDQSGLVVHLFNDIVKNFLRVDDLSLNFRVLSVVSVTSAIDTDNVSKHKREFAAIIKLLVDICSHILVKGIQVTNIKALVLLMAVEILAEHRRPDVISVEHNIVSLSVSGTELSKDVILLHLAGSEFLRGLEEVSNTSTKHTLNANSSHGRHLRSEGEKKRLFRVRLTSLLEHLDLSSFIRSRTIGRKVTMSFLG